MGNSLQRLIVVYEADFFFFWDFNDDDEQLPADVVSGTTSCCCPALLMFFLVVFRLVLQFWAGIGGAIEHFVSFPLYQEYEHVEDIFFSISFLFLNFLIEYIHAWLFIIF